MVLFKDCVGCERRYVGCHSKCEEHARDRAILEEINRVRKTVQANEDAVFEVIKRSRRR